jgi:hypothetical protein
MLSWAPLAAGSMASLSAAKDVGFAILRGYDVIER